MDTFISVTIDGYTTLIGPLSPDEAEAAASRIGDELDGMPDFEAIEIHPPHKRFSVQDFIDDIVHYGEDQI